VTWKGKTTAVTVAYRFGPGGLGQAAGERKGGRPKWAAGGGGRGGEENGAKRRKGPGEGEGVFFFLFYFKTVWKTIVKQNRTKPILV
jgi:hypothetical protein